MDERSLIHIYIKDDGRGAPKWRSHNGRGLLRLNGEPFRNSHANVHLVKRSEPEEAPKRSGRSTQERLYREFVVNNYFDMNIGT